MTEKKKSVPIPAPPRTKSGQHPSIRAFRDKLDSINEGTFPLVEELNAKLNRIKAKSDPPKRQDPRREDDQEVPVDVVELEEEIDPPLPTPEKKGHT